MLEVSAEFAYNITFNVERIQKALPAGYLDATTLADYLVKKASYPAGYLSCLLNITALISVSFLFFSVLSLSLFFFFFFFMKTLKCMTHFFTSAGDTF